MLELARASTLQGEVRAPFDVVDRGEHHRLRRYTAAVASADAERPAVLLVPPLMLTAEIYDMAPDVSAVLALAERGIAPFVVDFGAPEHEAGGMTRSLDDHVRAVVRAIARVREITGRDVHLCGYSQGGMFAYQAAAYVRGRGIASLVTFGSPVDIHKSLPAVRSDVAEAIAHAIEPAAAKVLDRIEGLPGAVTSLAFRILSTRKELEQRIAFVRMLHDRERLLRRNARRRFLAGDGFVAWPGPAFRMFFDQFVVNNRMLAGGFVIDGRTLSLADLACPILAFVGDHDELARPAAVRAIAKAAPNADVSFATIPAGHFGLVIGTQATARTWPAVAEWIAFIEGSGPIPAVVREERARADSAASADEDADATTALLDDLAEVATKAARAAWTRGSDVLASAADTADAVRFQEPRFRKLANLAPDTTISASHELARRAAKTPDATFFLWRGRAFSYRDADARVTNVARGLYACGVRPGDRVAIVMGTRPSLLSAATALVRLGAVAVVAPPDADRDTLTVALARLAITRVVVDRAHADALVHEGRALLVLGGDALATEGPSSTRGERIVPPLPEGAIEMEKLDVSGLPIPPSVALDSGKARDVAQILLRPSASGDLRDVPVTNHRWALSAIGAAAACTIKPTDTVHCAVPLHHPTGLLVSVGAAVVGGARLALGDARDPERLLADIRRTGATVVFYAGEMLRPLLSVPASRGDRSLPIRLVAGSGMRPELAHRLRERFGFGTLEFYAGTAHRAVLADPSGAKPGSLGRPLPGSAPIALVDVDPGARAPVRDAHGHLRRTAREGLLAVRVADEEKAALAAHPGIIAAPFGDDDLWIVTNDVVRRDDDGDHWFVDALASFVTTPEGPVSMRAIEDALFGIADVTNAAAMLDPREGTIVAAFVAPATVSAARLTKALAALPLHARPSTVARITEMPLTDGFRPNKRALVAWIGAALERFVHDGTQYA